MKWSDHAWLRTLTIAAVLIIVGLLPLIGTSGGLTFSGDSTIVNDNRDQARVDVASWGTGDTAEVYVVYEDYSAGNSHVFFQRSTNAGETFETPQDLLVDPDGDDKQLYPCIDVYDQGTSRTVAIGYISNQPGSLSTDYYIMVQTSTNGGLTWSSAVKVTDDSYPGYPSNKMSQLDIAFGPNGNLFVVWVESSKAHMAYSTDMGLTWSPPQKVKEVNNPQNPTYDQSHPTIACDGNYVIVAFESSHNYVYYNVYYTRASTSSLTGSTLTFDTVKMLPKYYYGRGRTFNPRMVAEDGVFHVVWWDFITDKNGNNNDDLNKDRPSVNYTRSDDGGATWGVGTKYGIIVNTSVPSGWHSAPDIEIGSGGTLAVSWVDTTLGSKNVFVSISTDNGATWSTPARANSFDPQSDKYPPKVTVDSSDEVHVVWMERATPTSDRDIFHSRSIVNQAPKPVSNLNLIYAEEFDAMIGWGFNVEPDFKEYRIYLNETRNFTTGPDSLVDTITAQGTNQFNFTELHANRDYYLRVEVVDMEGMSSLSEELHFRTLPINQPPVFVRPVPTVYMLEDTPRYGALNMSRWVENEWVIDDHYGGNTEIHFDIEAYSEDPKVDAYFRDMSESQPYWLLDLFPNTPDWYGSEMFRVIATDPGKDGGFGSPDDRSSRSNWFNVTVNSTNDVPTWLKYEDLSTGASVLIPPTATELVLPAKDIGCIERQLYKFAIIGRDKDKDFITFTVEDDDRITPTPDLLDPGARTIFAFTPDNDDVPEINFTVRADDGHGGVRTLKIFLPVENVNDPPFFVSVDGEKVAPTDGIVNFTVMEHGSFHFNVTADDIDSEERLSLRSLDDRATIQKTGEKNWTVTFTAKEEDILAGSVDFQLQLLDVQKTDPSFLNVHVDVINIQDRPEWIPGHDKITVSLTYDENDPNEWPDENKIQAEWGEPVTFEGFARDKDNDPLNYTWWVSTLDESRNWTVYGNVMDFRFSPSVGGLEHPVREKFKITLIVSDTHTEPIQWFRELWVEKDDDNDNDGLPDSRELYFFGNLSQGPLDNPDKDGYNNIDEIGFEIIRYESEERGEFFIPKNEMNPLDPEVYPGHIKPSTTDDTDGKEEHEPLMPTWLLIVIISVAVILALVVAGIFVILSIMKKKEKKEEEDIEKRVEEMEKRQEVIRGLYGVQKAGEEIGPDQSTLDDLELDLGGQIYHEEGSKAIISEKQEKDQPTGPRWEAGSGPKFEDTAPGLSFGESLQLDVVPEGESPVDADIDEDKINETMNTLLEAADEFNEDEVKNAGGGRVLVGAVPMEEQVKQMQGGPASPGGPRVPPPGMDSMPQGVPPGQQPPTMRPAPVPKPGLPRVGPDKTDEN